MDFTVLSSKIQKCPKIYKDEYLSTLHTYTKLSTLPQSPFKTTLSLINFLTSTSHFYKTNYPSTLLLHLNNTTDQKLKEELINNIFILKHKKQITDTDFFTSILKHADLNKILSKVMIELTTDVSDLFKYYIENGTSKQMTFSMYMLCYLYENGYDTFDLIYSSFRVKSLAKICLLYLNNELEFCKNERSRFLMNLGNYVGLNLIKELTKKKDIREIQIKKLQCIDKIKKEHNIAYDISEVLFLLVDPSKEDLKDVLVLLVDNLDDNMSVLDRMIGMFCVEYRDDDFIVYGLNFLKEVVLRYDVGDYVLGKIGIFNRHRNASINVAYRGVFKAVKERKSDGFEIMHVRKKCTKEEMLEMKKEGADRSRFKMKNRKKDKRKDKMKRDKMRKGRKGKK